MKRNILSALFFASLSLFITVPSMTVSAEVYTEQGSCGENALYSIKDKTLNIYGSGKVDDYAFADDKYDYIEFITVGEDITAVGEDAFGSDSLKKIMFNNPKCEISDGTDGFGSTISQKKAVICGNIGSTAQKYAKTYYRTFLNFNNLKTTSPTGDCGNGVTWTLSKGVLSISGEGDMYSYDEHNSPFYIENENYDGSAFYAEQIKISSGVTTVGANAFCSLQDVLKITIASTVTEIEDGAFESCTGVEDIVLPENLEKIGANAFSDCTGLTSITIPESVTEIDSGAFSGCTSLNQVVILNSDCEISDDDSTFPDSASIEGYSGSSAADYASEHNISFESLNGEEETTEEATEATEEVTEATTTVTTATTTSVTTTTTKAVSNVLRGDANNDGKINSADAVVVLQQYANSLTGKSVTISTDSGDANLDGKIDAKDATKILSYYAYTITGGKAIDIALF